ncbi:divalent-cation tolerance protein CutA [bacterium]|nr:divalent-cation tolerance protein CutA [bacterium]
MSGSNEHPEFVVVFVTASGLDEAKLIAQSLLKEKLAPCVSIMPQVLSTFWWDGAVQNEEESLCIIKTRFIDFDRLKRRVLELHSYDVPEIICMPILDGSESYFCWMRDFFR